MDSREGYRFNIRSVNPIYVGIPFDSAGPGTPWKLNEQCQIVSLGSGDTFGRVTWAQDGSPVTIAASAPNGYAPFVCRVVAVTNQLVCSLDTDQTPLIYNGCHSGDINPVWFVGQTARTDCTQFTLKIV